MAFLMQNGLAAALAAAHVMPQAAAAVAAGSADARVPKTLLSRFVGGGHLGDSASLQATGGSQAGAALARAILPGRMFNPRDTPETIVSRYQQAAALTAGDKLGA